MTTAELAALARRRLMLIPVLPVPVVPDEGAAEHLRNGLMILRGLEANHPRRGTSSPSWRAPSGAPATPSRSSARRTPRRTSSAPSGAGRGAPGLGRVLRRAQRLHAVHARLLHDGGAVIALLQIATVVSLVHGQATTLVRNPAREAVT